MSKKSKARERYYRYNCQKLKRHDTTWENSHHNIHVDIKKFEDMNIDSVEKEKQRLLEESEQLKEQFRIEQETLKNLKKRKRRR